MPNLSHSSETESIVGIQFGVFSPDEIVRRSVVEVTSRSTQEGKIGGLSDPRMGVLENGKLCRTCGQNNHNCPGHFGHFPLARPMYYIQFYDVLLKVLRCVCVKCAKLLVNKETAKSIRRLKGENRWKAVLTACKEVTRCGEQTEDGCGARQPHRYHDESLCRIVAEWKGVAVPGAEGTPDETKDVRRFLEPEYVHRLLRRISDEDVDFMGFSRMWCRPDWLMCTVLAIPPPQVRPSVLQDNNQRSEDDLTQKLIDIINTNSHLGGLITKGAKKKAIDEWTAVVQYHIATFVDNEIPGVAQSAQRSGRPLKSLQQRLGTKEGRIRNNLQGKRVEFSARSVITPDPNISVEELGVPMKIAMNLTFPERATAFNIDRLYALVQNGPDTYPGAKSVQRADGRMISLKHVNTKTIQLYEGDVVNRHLLDGDPVLFNRQPSLHRMSMMCHRVRVLPYSTFRLNVSVTKPYNADFDGDEMNMHVPQSVEAATELREIAAVPKQLISPRLSKPLVSVVQDTLVGVNRLTRPTEFFTRREFMNLLVHSKRWDGRMPSPAKVDPVPLWSGQQVVSALLPAVHIAMGNKMWDETKGKGDDNYVVINNGVIQQGILDGDVFDKALIHILYNDFSPEMTVDFLDSLQAVVAAYLQNSGFSVGLSDLIADTETLNTIAGESTELKKKIESLQLQVHMGLFDNASGRTNQEEFEGKIFQTLDKAISAAGKTGLKSLVANNRMVNMVKCGSKGSDLNIAQMIALLGQQSIEGKRINYGFQDRTLPHFKRYDDGADARGFIESSFVKGLNPAEFFFHAMTGREGLIDTAVKTADSGYMQRQLVKTMEDLMTYHDGTVRDAGGIIVQYKYGDDGTSATKIENQPIGLARFSDSEIRERFAIPDVSSEKSQAFLAAVFEDRDILVNNVWAGRVDKMVQSAVHLPRLISNAIIQLNLESGKGTPVTGSHVLDCMERIKNSTSPDNRLWAALLRFHLNPRDIQALGFTRAAFDWLAEQIVIKHMKSWVAPGEMAGIIAAQSLGEPTTQMTLNSVDWDTEIIIACDGKILTPRIGEFIDEYILHCDEERIQRLPNDQLYVALDDGHDWTALSPDENGVMKWTKLEAITKHPVINEDGSDTILEVTTESGRTVKATKAKSFLRLENEKIIACNGSDLRIGDQLPIANTLAASQLGHTTTVSVSDYLPKAEWLYGKEALAAKAAMVAADAAGNRHWFSHANGKEFTVPYARSDSFREAFAGGKNMHADAIQAGCVYPKKLWKTISHIPDTIPLDRAFGFFCGAFVAEGSTSTTQIQITNNDDVYLAPIRALLDSWAIGHHTVSVDKEIEKTGIKGHTQSLIIHSTVLTAAMRAMFGRISYEKTLPAWVLQAPDAFAKGLIDGYFSGDGYIGKDGRISASSVSKPLITRLATLLLSYGIFSTFTSYEPKQGKFDAVHTQHRLELPVTASFRFAQLFDLTIQHKQARLSTYAGPKRQPKWAELADVVLDRVVSIKEIKPLTDRVYDVTVAETRNFTDLNGLAYRDTFHLSGVAAKSGMTRGVPRLKELLKVTQNPKATSLTIYLRKDLRTSKETARRLAQEMEFTTLKDLVTVSRVYYDPRDSESLIADDQDWLSFFGAFEQDEEVGDESKKSPWIVRLELDREKMFNKNITMEDLHFVIRSQYPEANATYTDHNSSRMVFRVRPVFGKSANALDGLSAIKQLQAKLLTQTLVRGLPGLRAVSYRKITDEVYERNMEHDGKYEPVEQFVLDTFGTNFLDVMIHPDVDGTRLVSNHIHDINEALGIEAARQVLFREIFSLFEQAAPVNYRHVAILCDAICNRGRMMSADRIGVNKKNKIGPLAKASFEQTGNIMLNAALFGEMDPVTGVSANIMTGQPIRGGTSFTQVLMDEAALLEFMNTAPPSRKMVERAPGLAQDEVDQLLDVKEAPGCRQVDLRLPAALPSEMLAQVDELPELEIQLVDE